MWVWLHVLGRNISLRWFWHQIDWICTGRSRNSCHYCYFKHCPKGTIDLVCSRGYLFSSPPYLRQFPAQDSTSCTKKLTHHKKKISTEEKFFIFLIWFCFQHLMSEESKYLSETCLTVDLVIGESASEDTEQTAQPYPVASPKTLQRKKLLPSWPPLQDYEACVERNISCSSSFEEQLELHLGSGQLVARTLELMSPWWKTWLRETFLLCCLSYSIWVAWRCSST